MRKVVAIENMTLDGYVDSQTGLGFEWTFRGYSPEVDAFGNQHVRSDVDTAMYGRRTFEGMRDFWSGVAGNPDAADGEKAHADWVTNVSKIAFSTTLREAGWKNTRIIAADAAARVAELKAEDGGTLAIYASPKLVHWFIDNGLIDEFRIMVHPVTVGSGTPLFHDKAALNVDLLESKTFDSGAVYLRYQVA
ncbi:dihydrofolate reductase family protein [Nocardia sp. NBC_01327]|uniref:dihydrofolate reductase family protein n=1 Tax=Nocardia sp. NBC_01327 TaxID=2903593 RepID=UPI002E159EAF|nr:dihydrofolate reductase family protein [Nocardia sp. NBC_01327]